MNFQTKTFDILYNVSTMKNNSWIYAQYISINDMDSNDYFSGYIITDYGIGIPKIVGTPEMWEIKTGTANIINNSIPKYDSVLIYKPENDDIPYTLKGQTLNQ